MKTLKRFLATACILALALPAQALPPIVTPPGAKVSGSPAANNCAKWIDATTIGDQGSTCGGAAAGGSNTQLQYNNAGALGGITGATTNGTTLTLVAPVLGTPASGTATNLTGTAAGLTAGNVTTNANLTGVITSVGNATSIASQTGTGSTFVVSAGPTITGTTTHNPAFAGSSTNVLSSGICTNAPASEIIAAQHCFGYGTRYIDEGQLLFDTNSSVSSQNAFGIRQDNVNAFATLTFQSPDARTYVAGDIYEHGAIGYVGPFNNATGTTMMEASNLPSAMTTATCSTTISSTTMTCLTNAGVNTKGVWGPGVTWALVSAGGGSTTITLSAAAVATTTNQTYYFGGSSAAPPPELALFQTGAVDTSGVTLGTCTVTASSTTMTCVANGGTNGQYVWAPGVTYGTTVSSGGGTTTLTMSAAALASYSGVTTYFNTTPVVLQRRVLDAQPLGTTNLRDFSNGVVLAVDRYNSRIGINTTTPATGLEVNGTTQLDSGLTVLGAAVSIIPNANFTVAIASGSNTQTVNLGGANNTTVISAAGGVANLAPATLRIAGNLWSSTTAPTVTSGLGTSPTVTAARTAAFKIQVGSSGSPTATEVLGMPTAATGWACTASDITTTTNTAKETATTTTSVTLVWSSAPTTNDVLIHQCGAF